ncbi:acyl-CoA dehydrogenase family protein [Acinetobacter johnsonii]|uniref:Acyl-CoA dehydrogenase family protein n=1 Tax=Acinetobacter johnsonii TaxID=40214 RepID=A0AA42IBI1_ACIJO|nr:acyl-CoA dehydrogenase family protein [Acinetobacter johnsonii]MDH0654877.1 acyl-CoA dehydrogenase family protein [Acinetobacter johnsonii]MDH2172641.1 acyl-CoA dehydrogenase family protein [Acinetobacter johnsonii]MDH2175698.1 acyl-CoA dehydrogenase family protein [Acinetobacter johnsonii]QPF35486.1 acyl-CoA dehydrogenase family protein [Acinetobacter johnsonii]QQT59476.1 acyl-CoA dehydrogenase family protein [Acinetobacter johnsonii]
MNTAWMTHQISNQFDELENYNLFETDTVLQEILARYGSQDQARLTEMGKVVGSAEYYDYADLANRHTPILHAFDARGRRKDFIEFHPAWHKWMGLNRQFDTHAHPFNQPNSSLKWVEWAARFYLAGQVECGNLCPNSMTLGSIPLIQREPELWAKIGDKLLSTEYDERDVPISQKKSIWLGMGMTEKQGGSDVRANETIAVPVAESGRGQAYLLTGHKWFFSAPMCDAHLVVAKTEQDGLACFFVPRWLEDGTKNPIHVQRLKEKVGNRSNSSSEVEFKEAWGIMIGEAGRGIPTIIEMANYTRLTCSVGSTAMLKQALVQCIAYTRQRKAFGKLLVEQPLMRAVLADLALETEAAMQLSFHLAHCYETDDALSVAWKRIMTPASKFWICKRAVELTGETMEVFGGNGYVDNGIMARIFKEAPVNTIWEGSGNVMCLDVLRAISRDVESIEILFQDLATTAMKDEQLKQELQNLFQLFQQKPEELQFMGRSLVSRLVILAQAVLLKRHAPDYVADGFIQSRYSPFHGRVVGMLEMKQPDVERLLHRAFAA